MMTLSKKQKKLLARAQTLALNSKCKHRHGALVVKSGRVLSRGINSDRGMYSLHAETRAMRGIDVRGATVYIARANKRGETMLSRPCVACMAELRAAGVRLVVYTPGVIERV